MTRISVPWLKKKIQQYPLSTYVVLCYLFSWAFLLPCHRILLNFEEGTVPGLAHREVIYIINFLLMILLGAVLLMREEISRRKKIGNNGE